jgi:hypothetical protein
MATIRVASFLISSMIAIVLISYSHIPFGYNIVLNSSTSICTATNNNYLFILAEFLLVFSCFLPPSLMIVFCGLTLILVRRQSRRIMPINQTRSRQRNNQLLKILVIYATSNSICFVPFTITYFLQIFGWLSNSLLMDRLIEWFILWANINYATSFYLYTLGAPFYRDQLYSLIRNIRP